MLRQERENMVHFLSTVKEMSFEKLMMLTDEDLEHLYTRFYSDHEVYAESL